MAMLGEHTRVLSADAVASRPPSRDRKKHRRLATAATLFALAPVALGAAAACSSGGASVPEGPRVTATASTSTTHTESPIGPTTSKSPTPVETTPKAEIIGTPEQLTTSTGKMDFSLLTSAELDSHLLEIAQSGKNVGLIMDLNEGREGIYTYLLARAELGNTDGNIAILRFKDRKEFPVFLPGETKIGGRVALDMLDKIYSSGTNALLVGSFTPVSYDGLQSLLKKDLSYLKAPKLPVEIPYAYEDVTANGVTTREKVAYILQIQAATTHLDQMHAAN